MSLVSLSSGITITGTYEKGPSLLYSSIGTVFAFFHATVHRSVLDSWVNVNDLVAKFPQRVSIAADTVSLAGPVLIAPNRAGVVALKIILSIAIGVLSGFVVNRIVKKVQESFLPELDPNNPNPNIVNEVQEKLEKLDRIRFVATMVATGVLMGPAFMFLGSRLAVEPGIYFYNWKFSRI